MISTPFEELSHSGLSLLALEVYRDGKTLLHFSREEKRYPIYSITKSVTSAAFSLARDDGLIEPDTRLSELMTQKYRTAMPQGAAQLPLSRLLTMRAGKLPFRAEGENWTEYIFSLDIDYSDDRYCYSNIPAYLVGAAVENAIGGDLPKYLKKRLFDPLGIEDPIFAKSPEGVFYGASGMELNVHELALLGELYLRKGLWNGEQLISEASIADSVKPRVDTGYGDSYGYFFRVEPDHYSMMGKWGQRCMVYPEKDMVIAYLSHTPERKDELYALMKRYAETI